MSNSVCRVPLIVCNTGARVLFAIVECHILSSLSNNAMLGFDWLCTCNPYIDWWACILSVKVTGGYCHLGDLPCDSIQHVELAF